MEKKHRCKLCFRNFANGRALGGHMRSHMMKFYAEERASKLEEEEEEEVFHSYSSKSMSSSSSSSSDEEDEDRTDHHEMSVVVQDRESETESSKKKNCRRSKRVRKSRSFDRFSMDGFFQVKRPKFSNHDCSMETEALSSISDTTPEEHVAHCLMMLSKDKWEKEETEEKMFADCSEDSGIVKSSKVRGKYKCEACNKLFRSYQALGGHRASHKKMAAQPHAAEGSGGAKKTAAAAEEKVHQCPFCDRIFSSGQALGGHKRSHFIGVPNSTNFRPIKQKSRIAEALNIDLNMPAPIEDDEIAVSAVSDAEFVQPIKQ